MKAAGPSACALAACLLWPVSIAVGVATAGPDSALRLQSDYLPFPIHFDGDQSNREMRSIRIVGKLPPAGDGDGEIWLDTRAAEINSFGDVVQRVGPEPTPFVSNCVTSAKVPTRPRTKALPSESPRRLQDSGCMTWCFLAVCRVSG
mgnify:CR=1 FL=1